MPDGVQAAMPDARLFVVDDDIRARTALTNQLEARGFSVRSFASAEEFLHHERGEGPSCLILDLRLPSVNGLQLQERLQQETFLPIIFISGHGDIPSTVRAMKGGAVEFLEKPIKADVLVAAVHSALNLAVQEKLSRDVLAGLEKRYATLTSRERDVLPLVIGGHLNKQAAAILSIAEVTLEVHKRNVLQKMGAQSIADLVRISAQLKIQPKTPEMTMPTTAKSY